MTGTTGPSAGPAEAEGLSVVSPAELPAGTEAPAAEVAPSGAAPTRGSLVSRVPRRLRSQPLGVVAAPVAGVGLLWLACALAGVASAPGCNPVTSLLVVVRVRAGVVAPSGCTSVPLSADFPSLVLAAMCPLAVVVYVVLVRRLRSLDGALVRSHLLDAEELRRPPVQELIGDFRKRLHVPWPVQLVLFAAILGIGLYFHRTTVTNGQLFADLSRATSSPPREMTPDPAGLAARWWANDARHPVLAALWVLVGTFGASFSLKYAWIYFRMFFFLLRVPATVRLRALTSWQDENLGWRPVKRLLAVTYLGFLTFMAVFITTVYLLGRTGGAVGSALVAVFALLGLLANVGFLVTFVLVVRASHIGAVDRDLARLRGRLRPYAARAAVPTGADAALLVRADQLRAARRYPLQGRTRLLIGIVPGLLASVKFVNDMLDLLAR